MNERDVWIREVGTRDGLQSIATIFPTAAKLAWIEREAAAGVPEIEVGSFVPPKLLPQMADTAEVVAAAQRIDGLRVSALVPNLRGAQNAFAAGVDQVNYVLSVSEAHSQANVRKSVAEAIDDFGDIVAAGTIERIDTTTAEIRDRDHPHLPRIAFEFNRRHYARLRQMIDAINGRAP